MQAGGGGGGARDLHVRSANQPRRWDPFEAGTVLQGTGVQVLRAPKNEQGLVAQSVEHLLDTQKVVGAHPTEPITRILSMSRLVKRPASAI